MKKRNSTRKCLTSSVDSFIADQEISCYSRTLRFITIITKPWNPYKEWIHKNSVTQHCLWARTPETLCPSVIRMAV